MQEIITVFVRVEQAFSVKGQTGSATMLLFSGYAQGENFKGKCPRLWCRCRHDPSFDPE